MVICGICKEDYNETHIEFHLLGVHGVAFIQDAQCIGTEPKVRNSTKTLKMSKILIFLHFKALKRSNNEKSVVFLHFGIKKVEKIQNLMQKNYFF